MSEEEDALSAARSAQAAWDAAALIRALLTGDSRKVQDVMERPGLDPVPVMYRTADLAAQMLNASPEMRDKAAAGVGCGPPGGLPRRRA
jgi:hypothetical protein